ncbi:hypothetical protein BL127_00020660 [Raoultella planticola]|nr:hypothetical protein BL127_00020660 [Raoultella planticola]
MNIERSWTPDWFLESVLNWHTDSMINRYACLRAIRKQVCNFICCRIRSDAQCGRPENGCCSTANNQILLMHTDRGNWHSLSAIVKPLIRRVITGSDIDTVVENKLR